MIALCTVLLSLVSALVPTKTWFAPGQPPSVTVKAQGDVTLVLTDFFGKPIEPEGDPEVKAGQVVDVRALFPLVRMSGTYLLFAMPKGAREAGQFAGTPLVIGVRDSRNPLVKGTLVTKVEPLRYAVMTTDRGAPVTLAFYYDVAPNTVDNFLRLAGERFYDGLTFHRIVPEFVVQGGDPRGDGNGDPGYHVEAEFSDVKHEAGVVSMARLRGRREAPGVPAEPEAANSAGSQFFICLNYENTRKLDRKYTAFGRVVRGMETVKAIAAEPLADAESGRPTKPPVIKSIEVRMVTAGDNPYAELMVRPRATTRPAGN